LLQHVAGRHRLMFGFALFAVETIEQGSEIFDFAAEGEDAHFFFAQSAFEIFELAQNFAQFALHRKRALGALLASGDGDVVEAFAGLREEESVRIFEGKAARYVGSGNDVAVAQLGQNDFQRLCQSRSAREWYSSGERSGGGRSAVRGFVEDEGKLGLRVFGMNQEGGAAVDVGAQQAQAFVGSVPGLDHDVVQFVAQEVFDHALVARLDFEEVGEHADGARPPA
jgi:hypothetical protein